jgi:ABC-type phosphate transport system ATPase subunit
MAKNDVSSLKNSAGINYISVGMNYMTTDPISQSIYEIQDDIKYKDHLKDYFVNLEKNKDRWMEKSLECSTLYDWLKEKIYDNTE